MTVKQLIAKRARPGLPYLFMVTSKARMGDQFPSDVRYFIDFAQQATDLNALLQGLVGRACGYGKKSLVILSDRNHRVLDRYVTTHGDYVLTPSRHSVVAGGASGVAERHQITIDRDPSDPILEAFFQDIDQQVVCPTVPVGPDMKPHRAPKGGRRGPILTLAEKHKVFDHVESPSFGESKLGQVFGPVEIVRRGETISLKDANGNIIPGSYLTDDAGGCRYNFRKNDYAGRAGVKGRGRGQRDAVDPALNQGVLEPSIGLQKRESATGAPIDSPHVPGEWTATSITLPLRKPCLMGQSRSSPRVSLPKPNCVYEKRMTKGEREMRDGRA
jgi:hypothetical protein